VHKHGSGSVVFLIYYASADSVFNLLIFWTINYIIITVHYISHTQQHKIPKLAQVPKATHTFEYSTKASTITSLMQSLPYTHSHTGLFASSCTRKNSQNSIFVQLLDLHSHIILFAHSVSLHSLQSCLIRTLKTPLYSHIETHKNSSLVAQLFDQH
jgi:hypothetical protein